jgi:hypothetical protein
LQGSHFFVNSFLDSKHLKDLIANPLDFMVCIPTLDIAHTLSSIFQAVRYSHSLALSVSVIPSLEIMYGYGQPLATVFPLP